MPGISTDIIPGEKHRIVRDFADSWVRQLCRQLPQDVSNLIGYEETAKIEVDELDYRARLLAFNLFSSPLGERLRLRKEEKLPDIYTAGSYINREFFLRLNESVGRPLSDDLLAQAMFLHRGLFLEAYAGSSLTYMLYLYRGRMLESIPPSISMQIRESESIVPLAKNTLPDDKAAIRAITKFYYDILDRLTWTTYDDIVPFIGTAILAKTGFNLDDAFDVALEFRRGGTLRSMFIELDEYRNTGDRVMYDMTIDQIKKEMINAARHLGLNDTNPLLKPLCKLVTFWLPEGLEKIVEGAVALVPGSLRQVANKVASRLLTTEPHQMLLIDHVKALRDLRSIAAKRG